MSDHGLAAHVGDRLVLDDTYDDGRKRVGVVMELRTPDGSPPYLVRGMTAPSHSCIRARTPEWNRDRPDRPTLALGGLRPCGPQPAHTPTNRRAVPSFWHALLTSA